MKITALLFSVLLAILLIGCNEETTERIYSISGTVQKGPFINGSEIVIYELSPSLSPTGKSFHSTISNVGKFEITSIPLVSSYVELVASGFYFNEVTGELSTAPITLKAIVNLDNKENINVNLLTNLEFRRVKYLINHEGKTFDEAKEMAKLEILKFFNFNTSAFSDPELLDISASGNDNAILLAISSIFQGNLSTAEMSKCMSDLITDIETDGTIDNSDIQNLLYSQAKLLNVEKIKQNIVNNYSNFGIEVDEVNHFEEKIAEYITNSEAQFISPFVFPPSTSNGINLLNTNLSKFQVNTSYVFAVEMPATGEIKIKLEQTFGPGFFYRNTTNSHGVGAIVNSIYSHIIFSSKNNELIEAPIHFEGYGEATIEVFYNDEELPTTTKTFSWGGYNDRSDYNFPHGDPFGMNLFSLCDSSVITSDSIYLMAIWPIEGQLYTFNFELNLPENTTVEVVDSWGSQAYSIVDSKFNVTLNNDESGFVGNIKFKFNGEGIIGLTSDFAFQNGSNLTRTFYLEP